MKRQYAEDGENSNDSGERKRHRGNNDRLELRVLIPNRATGAIIGKKGDIIKRLRNQFDAKISVPDSTSPDRVLTISAKIENLVAFVDDVIPRIEENFGERKRSGSEIRLLIHDSLAGAIIGRNGSHIKELREKEETQITIFPVCAPHSTDRVIVIGGKRDKIVHCVHKIIGIINEIPIKGEVRPYEAKYYEPRKIELYGGYPSNSDYIPRAYAFDIPRFPGSADGRRSNSNSRFANQGNEYHSRNGPNDFTYRESRDRYGFSAYHDNVMETTHVTIPTELGGVIIGKGGDQIRRVREESGARVLVEPSKDDDEDRLITITGTPTQIRNAQLMLQDCIASSRFSKKYR